MPLPSESTLISYLPRCRWFRSKAVKLDSAIVEAQASFGTGKDSPLLAILKAAFADGSMERYALPLVSLSSRDASLLPETAVLDSASPGETKFCDASWDARFRQALFEVLSGRGKIPLNGGMLVGKPLVLEEPDLKIENNSRVLNAEQSNTSFVFDSGYFVKLYRRLEAGIHPEPEILRFLREHTDYRRVPRFHSSLEWERGDGPPVTVALMQEFAASDGNAWEYVLKRLQTMRERSEANIPGDLADWVSLLGRRVAELHAALASRPDVPGFAPEPLRSVDLDATRRGILRQLDSLLAILEKALPGLNPETKRLAAEIMEKQSRLYVMLKNTGSHPTLGSKIRTHGDLHLGQILAAPEDVWITDFEGEPSRTLEENRRKHSPLRDVAGMLRSFHYAVSVAARAVQKTEGITSSPIMLALALDNLFMRAYCGVNPVLKLLPSAEEDRESLLNLFSLEKTIYEVMYELNNRPDWVAIPLQDLAALVN